MPEKPVAIVLDGVAKHFKKMALRREYSTLKSELVRILTGKRKLLDPGLHIEALKRVDLVIPKGETVGIIGRNGSGKSTLLKLITGIYSPSSGKVSVNGRISALLDLGAGFHPDFTGRENILINGVILGMSRADVKARTPEIISFAELGDFIDEPVRTYSSGMFMRLAFAVATHVDPEILIIDEILAVGDEHFQRKSLQRMMDFKASGRTIILVTHDLNTTQKWCDRVVWLDGGCVRREGPPGPVIEEYRRAVTAAETQLTETGSSALSAPGLALPETVAAPPPPPPIRSVTLSQASVPSGARVELLVEVEGQVELAVQLVDAAARVLLAWTLPASGTVRMAVDHLPFAPGTYTVRAFPKGAEEQAQKAELTIAPTPHDRYAPAPN